MEELFMEISRYGQSTMRLVSGDVALIADPNLEESEGSDAEIVLVSADATDNVSRRVTEEGPRVIRGPGQYEVRGYNITGIGTALRDEEGSCRINTVYVIRAEGLSVCHLGQLNSKLTARQLDSLGAIDVLITPSGGEGSLGPKEIAELINVLGPRIVIPVQYGADDEDGAGSADALLSEMNMQAPDAQNRLNVTQTNLPRETRVVLFQQRG
jgi:L-ascorbate metabolism protein UlaG (beta-lactamase superfamily)